jgi:SET domain-containing protein
MLLVKTYLDRSTIHGVGLFAAQNIPKGTVIWRLNRIVDLLLSERDLEALSLPSREQIKKYTYQDRFLRQYVLCGDDARFFNHADGQPNCLDLPDDDGGTTVASRDIREGEELTCDYASFDADHVPHVW